VSASLGKAIHRFDDGSEHVLRVEIGPKGASGFVAAVGEPDYFNPRVLKMTYSISIGGARQARVLASLLSQLADRLEARGDL
jgi:hypothetical protein